jgi:hypothetical protein
LGDEAPDLGTHSIRWVTGCTPVFIPIVSIYALWLYVLAYGPRPEGVSKEYQAPATTSDTNPNNNTCRTSAPLQLALKEQLEPVVPVKGKQI